MATNARTSCRPKLTSFRGASNNHPEKKEDKPAARTTTIPSAPPDMGVGDGESGECRRYQKVLARDANDGEHVHLLLKVGDVMTGRIGAKGRRAEGNGNG